MAFPQKLRVTKKQAIFKTLKEEYPRLPEIYIKKEYFKVWRSGSKEWLEEKNVMQCSICKAWDKVDTKTKVCKYCVDIPLSLGDNNLTEKQNEACKTTKI